jgi:hypothetical protein
MKLEDEIKSRILVLNKRRKSLLEKTPFDHLNVKSASALAHEIEVLNWVLDKKVKWVRHAKPKDNNL